MFKQAKMAELVDVLASGVSVLIDVRVQVPLFAPVHTISNQCTILREIQKYTKWLRKKVVWSKKYSFITL